MEIVGARRMPVELSSVRYYYGPDSSRRTEATPGQLTEIDFPGSKGVPGDDEAGLSSRFRRNSSGDPIGMHRLSGRLVEPQPRWGGSRGHGHRQFGKRR